MQAGDLSPSVFAEVWWYPQSWANGLDFPRPDQVSVLDTYQYDDGCEPCGNDTFSREPSIVRFFSPLTGAQPFPGPPAGSGPVAPSALFGLK